MDPEQQKQLEFVADKPASDLTAEEAELIVQKHLDAEVPKGEVQVEPEDGLRVVAYDYAKDHYPNIMVGLSAALVVGIVVEAGKPWLKLGAAKLGWKEDLGDAILKTIPYFIGVPVSALFNFDEHWYALTGTVLDGISALLVGGFMTGAGAQLGYHLIHRLQIVKTIQVKWQRITGVTKADLEDLRTREHEGIAGEPDAGSSEEE